MTAPRYSQDRGVQDANRSELVSSNRMSVDDTLAPVPQRGQVAMTKVWLGRFMRACALLAASLKWVGSVQIVEQARQVEWSPPALAAVG
jgi:hypothetical protein